MDFHQGGYNAHHFLRSAKRDKTLTLPSAVTA